MEIRYYGDKISERIAQTPEGFLICQDVPISRTGFQTYYSGEIFDDAKDAHRIINVYRPAEEVFDMRSLASFEGKPVTNEHPDEDVSPENYHQYACGHVQNVHIGTGKDANKVLADLYITDPVLIDLIKNGKREISCGYYASEKRDSTGKICQTKIRGNHVAVVRNGRAGKHVCIRDHAMKRRRANDGCDIPVKKIHAMSESMRLFQDAKTIKFMLDYGVKGMKKGVRKRELQQEEPRQLKVRKKNSFKQTLKKGFKKALPTLGLIGTTAGAFALGNKLGKWAVNA